MKNFRKKRKRFIKRGQFIMSSVVDNETIKSLKELRDNMRTMNAEKNQQITIKAI
jgi:hypothetical protein